MESERTRSRMCSIDPLNNRATAKDTTTEISNVTARREKNILQEVYLLKNTVNGSVCPTSQFISRHEAYTQPSVPFLDKYTAPLFSGDCYHERHMRNRDRGFLLFALLAGAAIGIGAYTFVYARGSSYLTDDPAACANCHIMTSYYDAWLKGSHRNVAVCNDCHTPDGFMLKYASKASNGFWHSFGFTTGLFHEPLQIKSHNLEITNSACEKCHKTIVESVNVHPESSPISCIRCHASVGHM